MTKKEAKILLVALIVLLGIGYAVIRSGLNINGTTHVMNNTWDVHFENYQASSGSVTPTTEPSTTGNPTSVSYEVTLTNPGDYYEFTIEAVNNGTMDVMIESFFSKIGNTEITPSTLPPYLSYSATYSDGAPLANKQQLLHNTRETLKLKVGYRDDIPTTDLPSTVQDLSLSFTITYVQDDGTGEEVNHPLNGIVYVLNGENDDYTYQDHVSLNRKIPDSVLVYKTNSELFNKGPQRALTRKIAYLKHNLENDIVKESYVEFVLTDEDKARSSLLAKGTYTLQGGIDESQLPTNQQVVYNANKSVLTTAFGSSNCTEDTNTDSNVTNYSCYDDADYIGAYVDNHGEVQFDYNIFDCDTSICNYNLDPTCFERLCMRTFNIWDLDGNYSSFYQ